MSNRVLYFAAYGALSPVFGASRQTVLPRQGNSDLFRMLRVQARGRHRLPQFLSSPHGRTRVRKR